MAAKTHRTILPGMIHLMVCRGTFAIQDMRSWNTWFIQFSLKDPWLVPQVRRNVVCKGDFIAGWLFLYTGILRTGHKEETDECNRTDRRPDRTD